MSCHVAEWVRLPAELKNPPEHTRAHVRDMQQGGHVRAACFPASKGAHWVIELQGVCGRARHAWPLLAERYSASRFCLPPSLVSRYAKSWNPP
jgi:hypothetical protein